MKQIIGLTGSIATGKTSVSQFLRSLNYEVIDADEISRNLLQVNGKCYDEVIATFGRKYLKNDLSIDRLKLGKLIFNDKNAKKKLEAIIHPQVIEESLRQIEESEDEIIFLSVPLLFESKMDKLCDKIICVFVSYETQIKRLMERDKITKEEAINKINAQMPIISKLAKSDYVVDNNDTLHKTYQQVLKIIERMKNNA